MFRCDCLPVVQAIEDKSSKQPAIMFLLRQLAELACKIGFDFKAVHIAGKLNVAADILSRDGDCQAFRTVCPYAHQLPSPIVPLPLPGLDALLC